ncbi:hypothetical protein Tco_1347990, partial [Tanacetum coccineum]
TVSKVPSPEDTIKFMLNTQEFIYTMDMFRDILHLPVETLDNPFVAPVNIETIEAFMKKVFNRCLTTRTSGHDHIKINILQLFHAVINRTNVDYAALLWWDFMNNIPQRIKEDYHSIKDDIPLVSVYTTEDVRVRGMLNPDAFLTEEIRATNDFKKYETITIRQQKVVEENKDDDDSEDRLKPGSHKNNLKNVDDDDDKNDEKVDEEEGGALRKICQGYMIQNMERKCVTTKQFWKTHKQVNQVLHLGVSQLAEKATEELIENNLKPCIIATIIEDRDAFLHPSTTTSIETISLANLQQQLYFKMKRSLQDQANDTALWEVLKHKFEKSSTPNTSCREDEIHSHHDDHQEDDAPPEGEKRVKRHKASKSPKSARGSSSKHSV